MKKRLLTITAAALAISMLSSTAAFAQGWEKVDSKWYYRLEDNSVAKSTWVTTEGGTYWLNGDGVMAVNQWVNDGDKWYYVDANGNPTVNSLLKIDNQLYWFGEDGVMAVNQWVETETGKWYYFQDNGSAISKGWKLIDGDYYYFLNSGVMASDALVPGGYRVGPDGRWVQ